MLRMRIFHTSGSGDFPAFIQPKLVLNLSTPEGRKVELTWVIPVRSGPICYPNALDHDDIFLTTVTASCPDSYIFLKIRTSYGHGFEAAVGLRQNRSAPYMNLNFGDNSPVRRVTACPKLMVGVRIRVRVSLSFWGMPCAFVTCTV